MASFNPQEGTVGGTKPKSGGSKTLLIVLGVLGFLALGCCGVFGGLAYWGASKFNELVTEDLRRRLSESEVAATELGTIESMSLNFVRSTEVTNEKNAGGKQDEPYLVFDVKGSKASGEIICEIKKQSAESQEIVSCVFVKSDGTEVELFGEELSIDMGAEIGGEAPAEPATP
jgi:hypothetical protein